MNSCVLRAPRCAEVSVFNVIPRYVYIGEIWTLREVSCAISTSRTSIKPYGLKSRKRIYALIIHIFNVCRYRQARNYIVSNKSTEFKRIKTRRYFECRKIRASVKRLVAYEVYVFTVFCKLNGDQTCTILECALAYRFNALGNLNAFQVIALKCRRSNFTNRDSSIVRAYLYIVSACITSALAYGVTSIR